MNQLKNKVFICIAASHTMAHSHPDPRSEVLVRHGYQYPALRISAFNIQIFGDTKYEKEGVTDILLQVRERKGLYPSSQ